MTVTSPGLGRGVTTLEFPLYTSVDCDECSPTQTQPAQPAPTTSSKSRWGPGGSRHRPTEQGGSGSEGSEGETTKLYDLGHCEHSENGYAESPQT